MNHKENNPENALQSMITRNFVLGFLALFTFLAASHSLRPTLPLYLKKLGSPEREIGVLLGIVGIASLISRLFVGGALLRYSEKRIMMVGALLVSTCYASYLVFRPFWPFLIMRFFQGVSFACLDTAVLAVIINATAQKYRGQALGYVLLASPLAMAISAASGVYLSNKFGFSTLLMSCIGLALCSFLFSWAIKGRDTEVPIEKPDLGDTRLLDFKILAPAILTFFTSFSLGGLFAFIPLYGLKCGITNPGFFFSAIAVMLFTGRTVGGKILVASRKDQVIPLCMTVMMIALVILSFSRTLPFFILVGLIWGAGLSFVSPASMAYALEYAGSSGGPALGTYQMFMDLGLALGPVVMGILVPVTGYPVMFLVLAFICLVNIGYFQFYVKRKALNR